MAGLFDDLIPQAQSGGGGLDPRGRDLAIRTIIGEAANEPDDGMAAVAHVIRNRVQAGRYGGSDVPSVVLAKNQFEPWNGGPARERMLALDPNSPQYQRAAAIVDGVWSGKIPDPTGGMTHFFAPKAQAALGRQPPKWGRQGGLPIGNHTFFAPEGRVPGAPLNIQSPAAQQASFGLFDDLIPKEGTAPVTPVERAPLPPPAGTPGGLELAPQAAQTDMGGYSPEQVQGMAAQQQRADDIGRAAAAVRGAYSGATANFSDELEGVRAAGGVQGVPHLGPLDPRYVTGLASLGIDYLRGGNGAATQRYEEARDKTRYDLAQAEAQYPGTTLAGQVGGAVAVPGGALLRGATMPARMAWSGLVGAGYGGLAGAGEGTTAADRASRAASGAAIGAGVGAVAPPLLAGAEGIVRTAGRAFEPWRNAIRVGGSVDREAARRVVGGLTEDLRNSPDGVRRLAEWEAARAAGQPVTVADLGGEATRAIARSAADTSPVGREAMKRVFDERYEGQYGRLVNWINDQFYYPNAFKQQEAIDAAAKAANTPAYAKAMNDPAGRALWDDALEQLASAPTVQNAIKQATITGRNRGALEGAAPFRNPFVIDRQTGAMTLATDDAGNRILPNLRFWDEVKKNLDKVNSGEARQFAKVLREHLDTYVPSYKEARGGAKWFFDAEDAITAGQNFVRQNANLAQARAAYMKLPDVEKKLFQDGFLSRFMEDLGNVSDKRDIVKLISQSPNAKAKIEMVLGREKWQQLEARIHVEELMNLARNEVSGNSKTARYLYQLGLAGGPGISGIGVYHQDPTTASIGIVLGAISHRGKNVDERIARRVAEMLVSKDPQVLEKGIRIVSKNSTMMEGLRNFSVPIAKIAGQQGTQAPVVQSVIPGRAEDDQPKAPRPPGQ